MSAIFGIRGPASEYELQDMGSRLAHTGDHLHIWSPAKDVFFGEVRNEPRANTETGALAAQLQLNLDWPALQATLRSKNLSRDGFSRQYLAELLSSNPVDAPEKIDGLFSMAYWDNSSQSLILACDRINYHNIYYVDLGARLAFASNYKALLALADFTPVPDADAVQFYLATRMSDITKSMFKGVKRVLQGHVVAINKKSEKSVCYWKPQAKPANGSLSEHASALRTCLVAEITRMAAPYERIGVTLSGGLDSAALLALVRHALPEKEIATYTIGHGESDVEITGARESAEAFGTEHHEVFFKPESIIKDLPYLVWLSEQCTGREESILQHQIEKYMAENEEVVLAGHGADMVFGGMPRHKLIRMSELLPIARQPLMELFQQTQTGRPPQSLGGKLASYLVYRGRAVPPPEVVGASGPTVIDEPRSLAEYIECTIVEMDSLAYHSTTQFVSRLSSLMPFLAKNVMEVALRIPTKYKTGPRQQKIVLREALKPLMPDHILSRKKAIQRVRHDEELSDVMDHIAVRLLSPGNVRSRGLVDEQYVESVRRRPGSGAYSGDQLYRLWTLLAAEIWCKTFVDNRGRQIEI